MCAWVDWVLQTAVPPGATHCSCWNWTAWHCSHSHLCLPRLSLRTWHHPSVSPPCRISSTGIFYSWRELSLYFCWNSTSPIWYGLSSRIVPVRTPNPSWTTWWSYPSSWSWQSGHRTIHRTPDGWIPSSELHCLSKWICPWSASPSSHRTSPHSWWC